MIREALMNNKEFVEGINLLFKNRSKKKNLKKFAEELSELTTKILQKLNNPSKVGGDRILEELVDVQMHIIIAEMYYLEFEINDMAVEKINKMLNSACYKKGILPRKKKKNKL